MKDRIKTLRENIKVGSKAKNGKERHITQEAFAKALNLTQSTIAGYENGQLIPSDRTISDICRIYNVNEVWLRTGVGEMFRPRSREEEIAAFFGDVLSDRAPEVQRRLVSLLAKLRPEDWSLVEGLCQRIADEWTKKDPAEGQGRK